MTQALGDWRLWEGLVNGKYTSDVEFLGWLPGCTRRAVAIDLGEGLGTRNDRGRQTHTGCKSSVGGINACIPEIEITFIGINPISIHEILVEDLC